MIYIDPGVYWHIWSLMESYNPNFQIQINVLPIRFYVYMAVEANWCSYFNARW